MGFFHLAGQLLSNILNVSPERPVVHWEMPLAHYQAGNGVLQSSYSNPGLAGSTRESDCALRGNKGLIF